MIVWGGQSNMASCCIWVNRSQQSESHIPWSLIVLDYNFFTVSTRWKRTWRVDCSLWWTIKTDLSAFPSLITQVNTQATTERSQPAQPPDSDWNWRKDLRATSNYRQYWQYCCDNTDNTVVTILTILLTIVTNCWQYWQYCCDNINNTNDNSGDKQSYRSLVSLFEHAT